MNQRTPLTDSEVCIAAFYWTSHVPDRRVVLSQTLSVVSRFVRQTKCDAFGLYAFEANGIPGNEDVSGPERATISDITEWISTLDQNVFTMAINSHYGRKDKTYDHNWHIELNDRADILNHPSSFATTGISLSRSVAHPILIIRRSQWIGSRTWLNLPTNFKRSLRTVSFACCHRTNVLAPLRSSETTVMCGVLFHGISIRSRSTGQTSSPMHLAKCAACTGVTSLRQHWSP